MIRFGRIMALVFLGTGAKIFERGTQSEGGTLGLSYPELTAGNALAPAHRKNIARKEQKNRAPKNPIEDWSLENHYL